MSSVTCTVGVFAHNEAANIGRFLQCLLEQELDTVAIQEIIVVASGCTDGTEGIVRQWAEKDGRIRLLVEAERDGKASAINRFLHHATHPW